MISINNITNIIILFNEYNDYMQKETIYYIDGSIIYYIDKSNSTINSYCSSNIYNILHDTIFFNAKAPNACWK
jgi:hypothetical protein